MAKKFGKFLVFTAAVGAVAAGAYYYMQNKKDEISEDEDDFDDFDDDLDDTTPDSSQERSYVSLNLDDNKPSDHVEEFFDDDIEEEESI
ncbi:MAG: YtxH domain-containing protein [Lachnospiraceae bacterium]